MTNRAENRNRVEWVTEIVQLPPSPKQMLGHYRLLSEIGRGGMGRVYLAEDTRLRRRVAVKLLPDDVATDPVRLRRLETEARAAAALNHPNIVTLYSVEESAGTRFITMEWIRGRPLRELIGPRGLKGRRLLELASQLAGAIAAAHEAGIVHRDLKPDNVMVLDSGVAKILDFGLARLSDDPGRVTGADADGSTRTVLDRTSAGTVLGTSSYMSPEQAQGRPVDFRSDLFSFGVLLFEMATGKRPFVGDGTVAILSAIVKDTPPPLRAVDASLSHELEDLVKACLAKDPAKRPASAGEVAKRLERLRDRTRGASSRSRGLRIALWGAAALAVSAAGILIGLHEAPGPRWNDEQSPARIERLIDSGRPGEAFELARSAPDADSVPDRLWRKMSRTVTLRTDPPGARVSVRRWDDPRGRWTELGETPLQAIRVASAAQLLRVEKQGYPALELAYDGTPLELTLHLLSDATTVVVPGGRASLTGIAGFYNIEPVVLADYRVDRKEVTNREFAGFIKAGGYRQAQFWEHPFVQDGRDLSFTEAMSRFVDATGRPGPSTWRLGSYPEDQAEYPVAGISWYEAAAYARFAGKRLPTIFHWFRASGQRMAPALLPAGNFASSGPRPVGPAVQPGAFGLYDMAGNVREWCLNASGDSRFILGGSWSGPSYMFAMPDHRPPFDRSPANGMRCVDYSPGGGPAPETVAPVDLALRDVASTSPVSDEQFEQFLRLYESRPVMLDAEVEAAGESSSWLRQRIEYSAGHDDERMFAWLFLPKNSHPPFQAVVLLPGGNAFDVPTSADVDKLVSWDGVDFVVGQGRAVLYPVLKYMYERRTARNARDFDALEARDAAVYVAREIRQSMRYLQTRDDIDIDHVAYYGSSWGAMVGPIVLAAVPRFRTAILRNGGLWLEGGNLPECDALNFAPRVKIPVLMLNGRYDAIFPVETSQLPLFERLGAPPDAKRHVLFDVGHDFPPRDEMIRETLDWLDTQMGEVQ